MGSSINVIPYTLYTKLHDEIYACDLQPTDMEIKLTDGTLRKPYGMVLDVYVILGTFTYRVDFVVLEIPEDDFFHNFWKAFP